MHLERPVRQRHKEEPVLLWQEQEENREECEVAQRKVQALRAYLFSLPRIPTQLSGSSALCVLSHAAAGRQVLGRTHVIPMDMVRDLLAGGVSRCSAGRTSSNRQDGFALNHLLDLKTGEREREYVQKSISKMVYASRKHFSSPFSTKPGCKLSTRSAEDPTFGIVPK